MSRVAWMHEVPVAHRGLHDVGTGIIENTASAFTAAAEAGYAIECDLQISADGEAMVFHDDTLDRLVDATGRVDSLLASELKQLRMREGQDRIITLGDLCDLVGGRVPLVVEIKPSWGRDSERWLERRTADILSSYRGEACVMSFDPMSMAAMRAIAPKLPRGVVQQSLYDDADYDFMSSWQKFALANLLHIPKSRPDFFSWYVKDLRHRVPRVARRLGYTLLCWTVRTPEDQARAALFADQMTFEGFRP